MWAASQVRSLQEERDELLSRLEAGTRAAAATAALPPPFEPAARAGSARGALPPPRPGTTASSGGGGDGAVADGTGPGRPGGGANGPGEDDGRAEPSGRVAEDEGELDGLLGALMRGAAGGAGPGGPWAARGSEALSPKVVARALELTQVRG